MNYFFSDSLALLTYFLVSLSILSLWVNSRFQIWGSLLVLANLIAIITGRLTWLGIGSEAIFGLLCYLFYRPRLRTTYRVILGFSVLLISLLMGMHKLPGFKNWLVLSKMQLSPDATPLQHYLNFDKPLIGLFIVGMGYETLHTRQQWSALLKQTMPILAWTCPILIGLSSLFGYIHFEPKWYGFSVLWLFFNLTLTCISEEAFFRGFLQGQISKASNRWKIGPHPAWIFVSILFGLSHLQGGWTYVGLSTIAGLFYGFAYLKTRRLEASILTHFTVNAIHFIFFTYPALS